MKRVPVLLCSPYAASAKGDRATNDRYLRAAMLDSLSRGEAPFASHSMYPQFLDDADCDQRALGLECEHVWLGLLWRPANHRVDVTRGDAPVGGKVVVYTDLGISSGMAAAVHRAKIYAVPIERRTLFGWA